MMRRRGRYAARPSTIKNFRGENVGYFSRCARHDRSRGPSVCGRRAADRRRLCRSLLSIPTPTGPETKFSTGATGTLLLFGPTGSGKTKRFLTPNLLCGLEDRSVIVIDPKGELAAITANARREMGHDVLILNPFNVLGLGSAGFNPMAKLDPNASTFYDDAAAIGEALIKVEGSEPHWSESAQGLIVALIMWEKLTKGSAASLENIRAMLTEADDWVRATGKDGKEFNRQIKGLRRHRWPHRSPGRLRDCKSCGPFHPRY